MASTFGTRLRITIFGQSHSEAIGCVVEGLPAGIEIDHDRLGRFMERRAPGRNRFSTQRREADAYRIVGGLNERGLTCGTPLAALIENTNTRSADYDELRRVPRPGHADFGAWVKWGDARDVNGGGHFSARMTAPLCVAGGIAIQVLEAKGVRVAAHVAQVGDVLDERLETRDNTPAGRARLARQVELIESRSGEPFCTLSEEAAEAMAKEVDEAREAGDSVGGAIECVCTGLPAGIGGSHQDERAHLLVADGARLPALGFGIVHEILIVAALEIAKPLFGATHEKQRRNQLLFDIGQAAAVELLHGMDRDIRLLSLVFKQGFYIHDPVVEHLEGVPVKAFRRGLD